MNKQPFNSPLLRPTGVNNSFHAGVSSFQDYLAQTQTTIATGRIDLTPENYNQILAAVSPFELRPDQPNGKGILLIHGLYDSPFTWHDIAKELVAAGFLVRAILLPGHGTVPGDLLNTHYEAWLAAARYGVLSFANEVSELYLAGFSMGGALAIYQALTQPVIKGLILIAPALGPKRWDAGLAYWYSQIGKFIPARAWYRLLPQQLFVKYESYSCYSALQACRLITKIQKLLRQKQLTLPILIITSVADESVSQPAIMKFFLQQQQSAKSQLLIYANKPLDYQDSRISQRTSYYPSQKILDFSHISLIFAPDNLEFGENSGYHDFQHYQSQAPNNQQEIYKGAVIYGNLKAHVMERLTYNPDFSNMLAIIKNFLHTN